MYILFLFNFHSLVIPKLIQLLQTMLKVQEGPQKLSMKVLKGLKEEKRNI